MATSSSIDYSTQAYDFTESQDWFSHNINHWKSLFPHISTSSYLDHGNGARILEIGSWEGRSAVFLCDELLKSRDQADVSRSGEIVCIDHFDLFKTQAGIERYRRLNHNLSLTGKNFRIIPEFSFTALTKLLNEAVAADDLPESVMEQGFDWVYVDGSHRSDDTLLDGEMAWRLTRKGGLIIFDDYLWPAEPETSIHHPKRGIDAFLALHAGEYERLSAKTGAEGEGQEYQVVLKKTEDMRIGHLLPSGDSDVTSASLGATRLDCKLFDYGINIGITADSSYTMPLAVLLHCLLDRTPGRISVYLLDCGLTDLDKERVKDIFSVRQDATLNILSLPSESLTAELGSAVWAKIDLASIVPVERLLYLDADILIRGDIHSLWDTDLEGCPIGAALDIGHPFGPSGLPNGSSDIKYFNAGVLLMDLTKIRSSGEMEALVETSKQMKNSTFADQDSLNVHFRGRWKEVSVKWNAQGLGSYADSDGPGRHWVDRGAIANPTIVHFTGPVHPLMEVVLNPWVQPYTSKPWGYAGSPGHPFAEEWFEVLRKTAFQEYFDGEWQSVCEAAKAKKVEEALDKFNNMLSNVCTSTVPS
ncbi:hypothetical protein NMY22_g8017 [Coprinellus aureogranulatus]|nr:hypothetical protein NMY22_g8017 [Coprinellus aureogranulatus]